MHLRHDFYTYVLQPCAPGMLGAGQNCLIHFLVEKPWFSSPNSGENLPINTNSLILNEADQEEGKH